MKSPSLTAIALLALLALTPSFAGNEEPRQPAEPVGLARGAFPVRFFPPASPPRAAVVFGSGDGGWSYWEEKVSRHLAAQGFAVAGVDFASYAETDYSAAILSKDLSTLAAELHARFPQTHRLPVLYGGWSMGAEQSLAAAAQHTARPQGLAGLILVAPGPRGRFGLRAEDRMGIPPKGPNTFALRELAPLCADLRIAVFHAGLDLLDDLEWFKGLGLDLRLWTIPGVFHDFAQAGKEFQQALDESLTWLLQKPPNLTPAPPGTTPP